MKKYFAIIIFSMFLLYHACGVSADGLVADSGILFLASEHGMILSQCPDVGGKIYAEATIRNTSSSGKTAFLYICKYDGELLKGISFGKADVAAGSEVQVSANISVGSEEEKNYTYKAYIWDGAEGLGAASQSATFLDYPVGLNGITVGGKPIENYSDDVTEYTVKVSDKNEQIVLYPKSGSAKVTVVSYNVPGKTVINVSSGASAKTVTVSTYIGEEYLYSLSSLKYSVNGTEYEIEDFDPDELNYDVQLPDNTFFVRVTGTSPGEISYKVQDINGAPNRVAGVSFGKMRGDTTGTTYVFERLAIDRVIPIKNEETKAIIRVTDGTNTKKYTVVFYSKQPRLTEYTITKDAASNSYVPIYTSGASLCNDNGSLISADRMWTASNVSKSLIGASSFMSPCNNKNENELWWGKSMRRKGDEYFRFSADTPGTVIALGASDFDMRFEDYPDEIWTRENSGTKPSGIGDPREGNKAYNDYTTPEYFFYGLEWNTNTDTVRANLGVEPISGERLNEVKTAAGSTKAYSFSWSRHFDAGEPIVIRHTGIQGSNAQAYVWAIVWDDVEVNYPSKEIEDEKNAQGGANEPNVVVSYDYLNNTGTGVFNEFADTWKDLSRNSSDLPLSELNSSGWALNGFKIESPEDEIELSDSVSEAVNSGNFTVEFELGDSDGDFPVLTSKNERFGICAESGSLSVYMGSIVRNPVKVPVSEALKGVNHIVVSSNESKTSVKFKWYVNGELIAEKNFIRFVFKDADTILLGSKNSDFYQGSTCIKKLKIFDFAKSQEDITAELGDK